MREPCKLCVCETHSHPHISKEWGASVHPTKEPHCIVSLQSLSIWYLVGAFWLAVPGISAKGCRDDRKITRQQPVDPSLAGSTVRSNSGFPRQHWASPRHMGKERSCGWEALLGSLCLSNRCSCLGKSSNSLPRLGQPAGLLPFYGERRCDTASFMWVLRLGKKMEIRGLWVKACSTFYSVGRAHPIALRGYFLHKCSREHAMLDYGDPVYKAYAPPCGWNSLHLPLHFTLDIRPCSCVFRKHES